jgi:hypothetical protein
MATLNELPVAPEETVFNGLLSILRSNPDLQKANVKIFSLSNGAENTPAVQPIPSPDLMPVIRVRCGSYPMAQWTEHQHRGVWTIYLEMFVAGLDETDMLRLFSAVRHALRPAVKYGTDDVRPRMDPNSSIVQHAEFGGGSNDIVAVGEGVYAIKSIATFRIKIQVNAA